MSKIKIWHNPRCRKSREGLQYLLNHGIEPEIIEYLKTGIDADELTNAIKASGQSMVEFIRDNEADYKTLGLKGKILTPEEFAQIAVKHPKLLQRPIVVVGNKSILARPVDRINEIL